MDSEIPKNPPEEIDLSIHEMPTQETLMPPDSRVEQIKKESDEIAKKRIEELKTQLYAEEKKQPQISSLAVNDGGMELSIDTDAVRDFLVSQGLSKEQADELKIEFTELRWSNKFTRAIASFLPGRLKEIFTRIESLKGNTLKIFTNNIEAIYDNDDAELITRDIIHHLAHFVQKKKGTGKLTHLLSRLPIIHGLSNYEKEARKTAREANVKSGPLAYMLRFLSQREHGKTHLKIKI